MQLPKDSLLLRIFIGESDHCDHQPLYEALVMKARELHLAGATVLRGPMGFGHSSRLHTAKILRLSKDLPMVVEFVDVQEKIDTFLAAAEPMLGSALVTLEHVQVLRYGPAG
jgi:uncharacterized protein